MNRILTAAVLGAGALALGGCATYDPYYDSYGYNRPYTVYEAPAPVVRGPVYAQQYAQQVEYGVVERIDMYRGGSNSPISAGIAGCRATAALSCGIAAIPAAMSPCPVCNMSKFTAASSVTESRPDCCG